MTIILKILKLKYNHGLMNMVIKYIVVKIQILLRINIRDENNIINGDCSERQTNIAIWHAAISAYQCGVAKCERALDVMKQRDNECAHPLSKLRIVSANYP